MQGEVQNVHKIYNSIANWFDKNRDRGLMERPYLDRLISLLPASATILDVGCGTGEPIMRYLVNNKLNVIGVDASDKMLEIARTNFPDIDFILQDMRLLKLHKKFDAIIAWHSFFHLPADDQQAMFFRFAQHLNQNGILMFTSGIEHGEAWGENGGEQLYHASLDTNEYNTLLRQHKFKTITHVVTDQQCGGATVWLVQYLG